MRVWSAQWMTGACCLVWIGCSDKQLADDGRAAESAPSCAKALLFVDADLDGVGDSTLPEEACIDAVGHSAVGGDCDDSDPSVSPNANEICNGIDDDCDGSIDRGLLVDVWSDLDGDGFGDPDTHEQVCEAEATHVRDSSDCDDTDPGINPDGTELCDGVDQDCDGEVDEAASDRLEGFADADGDGMGDAASAVLACPGTVGVVANDWDCDDADPVVPVVVDAGETGLGSLESPLGSLQEGVDAALASGGEACVVVQPGLYSEAIDLSAGEVSVWGVEGALNTVVDGYGIGLPVLTLGDENQSSTLVEGLTLTGGTPARTTFEYDILGSRIDVVRDAGAGVYASGARAILRGVHITDNRIQDPELTNYVASDGRTVQVEWTGQGGGIFSEGGTLVIEDCLVTDNEAEVGGGVFTARAIVVQRTRFLQNLATKRGGGMAADDATVTVDNSIFAGNRAGDSATMWLADSAVLLSQITVKEDVPDDETGALFGLDRVSGIWSNLLLSAAVGDGVHVDDDYTSVSLEGALFDLSGEKRVAPPGSFRLIGDIEATPIFVDFTDNGVASDDDLHLDPDSPGVDAGLSGRDPDGSPADLGAYGGVWGDW